MKYHIFLNMEWEVYRQANRYMCICNILEVLILYAPVGLTCATRRAEKSVTSSKVLSSVFAIYCQ